MLMQETPVVIATTGGTITLENWVPLRNRIVHGEITAAELHQSYEDFCNSRENLTAELMKKTLKQLAPGGTRGETKPEIVRAIIGQMEDRFLCGQSFSWSFGRESPFENHADIVHVGHAYSGLCSGGRLIAIMSASSFFSKHRQATEFRAWLDEIGAWYEPLPEGAFLSSDRPTGVSTYLVVITH